MRLRRLGGAVLAALATTACGGHGGGGAAPAFSGFQADHTTLTNPGGAQDFAFGTSRAWLDWNGDGRLDLVVGSPGQTGAGLANVGSAFLYTQGADGSFALARSLGPTNWPSVSAVASSYFGYAVASGDFDGDGRDDLAIGAPGDTASSQLDAGRVYVLFNDATHAGVFAGPFGEPGGAQAGAEYGAALTVGALNADALDDLVVSATDATVSSADGAGRIVGLLGAAQGVFGSTVTATIASPSPVADGFFGLDVAVGDVDGDGKADLAVGEPGAVLGSGGAVRLFVGDGAAVPTFSPFQTLSTTEAGALVELGTAVALADVDGDGDLDVVAGAPFGDVGATTEAGYVIVYANANPALGAFAAGDPIPDRTQEGGAQFGAVLVEADLNGDGAPDLLVGAPAASAGAVAGAGSVTVFIGAGDGTFAQPSAADVVHSEAPTTDMAFGASLAAGDADGDGKADVVAAGAPGPLDTLSQQPGQLEVLRPLP